MPGVDVAELAIGAAAVSHSAIEGIAACSINTANTRLALIGVVAAFAGIADTRAIDANLAAGARHSATGAWFADTDTIGIAYVIRGATVRAIAAIVLVAAGATCFAEGRFARHIRAASRCIVRADPVRAHLAGRARHPATRPGFANADAIRVAGLVCAAATRGGAAIVLIPARAVRLAEGRLAGKLHATARWIVFTGTIDAYPAFRARHSATGARFADTGAVCIAYLIRRTATLLDAAIEGIAASAIRSADARQALVGMVVAVGFRLIGTDPIDTLVTAIAGGGIARFGTAHLCAAWKGTGITASGRLGVTPQRAPCDSGSPKPEGGFEQRAAATAKGDPLGKFIE